LLEEGRMGAVSREKEERVLELSKFRERKF
jgi:hypothetical protein